MDFFGDAVVVVGDQLLVGDPTSAGGIGSVFVFQKIGDSIVQEAVLAPPHTMADTQFGSAIAAVGPWIFVGAHQESARAPQSGVVHVFQRVNGCINYAGAVLAEDGSANDAFGWDVAADGELLVVGASQDSPDGVLAAGSAYIYRYSGEWWEQEAKLTAPVPQFSAGFGLSVALAASVVVVGEPGNSNNSAYVFRKSGGTWQLEVSLVPNDGEPNDGFGASVDITATGRVAVGAPMHGSVGPGPGAVYLWLNEDGWRLESKIVPSATTGAQPMFGQCVSLDDRVLVVGAPFDFDLGVWSGAAFLFDRPERSRWVERLKFYGSGSSAGERFAAAIDMDGDSLIVGATRNSAEPGSAYVFIGALGIDCNSNGAADSCDILSGASADENADQEPDECRRVDVDGDGVVGFGDLIRVLGAWGPCSSCPPACVEDVDMDCLVGLSDLVLILSAWD